MKKDSTFSKNDFSSKIPNFFSQIIKIDEILNLTAFQTEDTFEGTP